MMFVVQVVTAAINVVLNLILIPRFGIVGSAYATLISYWVGPISLFVILKSQHRALAMIGKAIIPYWIFVRPTSK
jgi:Na+-driven multidrug efflux pump